ncbi:MAG: AMP-binding protein [Chloroflexota bacterium]|nr:AMP-binding protein [Chloroflexota bacterium]
MAVVTSGVDFLHGEERRRYQEAWLGQLIRAAYGRAPAMRERIGRADASLGDIRITRKDEVIDMQKSAPPFGGLLLEGADVARVFLSPGPLLDAQGPSPDHWRLAAPLRAVGFAPGMVVHSAASYNGTPLGWMFDGALREVGCTVIPAGPGSAELQVQTVRALGATGYVGTPSGLRLLYEKATELGPAGAIGFKRACVAGEMLPPSLRAELESFGPTVCQFYGTAECGCLGYECLERDGMHVPADVVLELLDPETRAPVATGGVGEVVVTVNEPTYALVRFATGDLAMTTDASCRCGRGGERIVRIVGRVGDAVKVRGMFVHPRQVGDVVARFPQVRRWQAVVTREGARDTLTLRVVADDLDDAARESLARALHEVIKVRADIERAQTLPEGAPLVRDERRWT